MLRYVTVHTEVTLDTDLSRWPCVEVTVCVQVNVTTLTYCHGNVLCTGNIGRCDHSSLLSL